MLAVTSTPMSVNPGGPLLPTDTPLPFNPGGPMVPDTPVSQPASTPMSVQPGGPIKPPRPRNYDSQTTPSPYPAPASGPGKSCTWTTSETVPYPCSFNGVETVFPAIDTRTRYVDCHGCSNVHVDKQLWYCPIQVVTATQVVHTPKITWTTACAPVTVPAQTTPRVGTSTVTSPILAPTAQPMLSAPEAERRSPQGNLVEQRPAACPTTIMVQPGQSAGGTSTLYQQTTTTTSKLPCGGCPLVVSTALAGYGPAGRFTTTVTAPVGTVTSYACQ